MKTRTREDRRVKYTKMILKESLLGLMKEKSLSKISLAEICRVADINRNTFYTHYSGMEDLIASIEQDLYDELMGAMEGSMRPESIPALIIEICRVIQKNAELCQVLLSENGDSRLLNLVLYRVHDKSIAGWKRSSIKLNERQLERLYLYSTQGAIAVIKDWLQGGAKESPEEVANFIERITNKGISAFAS